MRHISIQAVFLSCLFILFSCASPHPKEEDAFCITYHVLVRDIYPHKLLISYNDAGKLVTFYCTEKKWSKQVCLSPNDIASLSVQDIFDPDHPCAFTIENTTEEEEWLGKPIVGRIVHKKKEVLMAESSSLQVTLLLSETDRD